MTMIVSGIYCITNEATGHRYVGQAKNVYVRKRQHLTELRHGTHPNKDMQDEYNKSSKTFHWELVETCSLEQLNEREIYGINQLDCINNGGNKHDHPYGRPAGATAERKIKGYRKRS